MKIQMTTISAGLSALAPVMGMATFALLANAAKSEGMASGIRGLFIGFVAMSFACALGGVAALAAMSHGMQPRWVAIVLLLVNALLALPGIWVLARMDWE